MIRLVGILAGLCLVPALASALQLTLPSSAHQTSGQDLGLDSYALPTGSFDGDVIPVRRFEGYVSRQSWRVDGVGVTPLQVFRPLRDSLAANGYHIVFSCADTDCGGYDFRFGTDVIAPPDMIVDLDSFLFVSALKGDETAPDGAVSLLVSQSRDAVYVQIIQVTTRPQAAITVDKGSSLSASSGIPRSATELTEFDKQLEISGHVILSDLVFATGSAELGEGTFDSLARIAAYLRANPTRRIALVGHTDAVGGLDSNIALSKRRAASVRSRLIDGFGVPDAQLVAEGVGYLAPVASNLSKEGREANRRVEAVLLSTQ